MDHMKSRAVDIKYGGGFTDANGFQVKVLDVVEHGNRFDRSLPQIGRRGILWEALPDGDATVLFKDNGIFEQVKWANLCKVPLIDEPALSPKQIAAQEKEEELVRQISNKLHSFSGQATRTNKDAFIVAKEIIKRVRANDNG